MRRAIAAAIAVLSSLAAPPAAAQSRDLFANCNGYMPSPQRIAGCTRLLNTPGLAPLDRAKALKLRATAYTHQRNFAAALADIDRAIALDPDQPSYYVARGQIFVRTGRIAEAKRDHATAEQMARRSAELYEVERPAIAVLGSAIAEAEAKR